MIDASPKPLPRRRLEKLIHGLRQRLSTSAEKTSAEVAQLSQQIAELETQHAEQRSQLQSEWERQRDESTTEWDQVLHHRWDDAEMRSFKAVFDTADREGFLRREARKQVEQLNAELKKRGVEIEQRFLKAKDVPIKRLNSFRAQNRELLEQLNSVEVAAVAALAGRGLRSPNGEPNLPEWKPPANSATAERELASALANAQASCKRLTNHPVAKFFESAAWWAFCGILFVAIAATLSVSGALMPVVAVLVAAVSTGVVLLLSMLGIRPWLKKFAAAEFPVVQAHVLVGRKLHEAANQLAVAENDNELKRLARKRDDRFEQAKSWRAQTLKELTHNLEREIASLREHAQAEKQLASQQLSEAIDETNRNFEQRIAAEQQRTQTEGELLLAELERQRLDIQAQMDRLNRGGALRLQIAMHKAMCVIARSRHWCAEFFPDWESLQTTPAAWPAAVEEPVFPLGALPLQSLLPEDIKRDISEAQLQAPLLFTPLQDEYLVITADPSEPAVKMLVRNLVMRGLTTITPGKAQVCVIDPPGLGSDFGWLMHLSDYDPQLVSHRVWTQPGHIVKQLVGLAHEAEDFIQQSLRNQYAHIVDYNREAGALAEPFRMLIWSSMPSGLDDTGWKSLLSLLDTGARCGVIPILIVDPNLNWPNPEMRASVYRRGLHLGFDADRKEFTAASPAIQQFALRTAPAAADGQAQQIVNEIGRRALLASRVEVPLANMVPPVEQRQRADSSLSLEIPIGQSGVERVHSLKLGVGTAQHAVIAGKTGSGKSSLLHAMITSAVLKYGPDRLRLVLLDFKKGVEFQVYSESQIAHADIIGIESHREFGLSALEYVDSCMQRRGEAFRQAGVQDLASWNVLHPEQPLPRMLMVIDEFQELFVEDDKLSGQASLILDRIVRQGRSFGVHAVLASQTLAGSYSLPRTTLGQMAVRIALQCDPSDAQIIFTEDNPAAARLKHPGQAVYNDAGGRIEGNQPMQIGWLDKKTQLGWFSELSSGYQNLDPTTNRLGRCVVYDGNRAATWNSENANLAIEQSQQEINPDALWCVLGESVAISPAVAVPLTLQAGRNVLIVGSDDPQAAAVANVLTASFVKNALHAKPQLFIAQGARPTDAQTLQLPHAWKKFPHCDLQVSDNRGVDQLLEEVYQLLQQRIEHEQDAGEVRPVLLHLLQLGRLRTLRRNDEFGLGGFGEEAKLTPDKHLEEILRDGPSHGVFTCIWAENYSTLNRWLSRAALRELEIRILMQMSANDSTNLIDTVAASRLGDHVMLVYDEATGQEQRFRPFSNDSLVELANWSASDATSQTGLT